MSKVCISYRFILCRLAAASLLDKVKICFQISVQGVQTICPVFVCKFFVYFLYDTFPIKKNGPYVFPKGFVIMTAVVIPVLFRLFGDRHAVVKRSVSEYKPAAWRIVKHTLLFKQKVRIKSSDNPFVYLPAV